MAKTFAPNKRVELEAPETPPVVTNIPASPANPVPPTVTKQSKPPPAKVKIPAKVPAKEPDNIPMMEPGMKEILDMEIMEEKVKPKPVVGPKKKSEIAMMLNTEEEPISKAPKKLKTVRGEPPKTIKPAKANKAPKLYLKLMSCLFRLYRNLIYLKRVITISIELFFISSPETGGKH